MAIKQLPDCLIATDFQGNMDEKNFSSRKMGSVCIKLWVGKYSKNEMLSQPQELIQRLSKTVIWKGAANKEKPKSEITIPLIFLRLIINSKPIMSSKIPVRIKAKAIGFIILFLLLFKKDLKLFKNEKIMHHGCAYNPKKEV